jgi:hypothetical protein
MLAERYHSLLTRGWKTVFAQQRTWQRAVEHALATPCCLGQRTVSRTVCALGRQQQDWSADYKLYSRSPWQYEQLFAPIWQGYLQQYPSGWISVALDDTKLKKSGRQVPGVSWQRDPMSPPFHVNFLLGLRFLQASLIFPHHQAGDFEARALPVCFRSAPVVKKPGRRAEAAEWEAYREARKKNNLSQQALQLMRDLRCQLDQQGGETRLLLFTLDGSLCNRVLFRAPQERFSLIARCRKDARLCWPAPAGSRRRYDPHSFTPAQVRQDDMIPWQSTLVRYGGQFRPIRYKELGRVLWRRGAGTRPLRLLVFAPLPYKLSRHARTNYREPAYWLCLDVTSPAPPLIQAAFDRWQIEINHRDEKSILGVGQAQLWSPCSVPRHPAFLVAVYSLLLLASFQQFGPGRPADFGPLPKWRRPLSRPSLLDILALLRKELHEVRDSFPLPPNFEKNLENYAYT